MAQIVNVSAVYPAGGTEPVAVSNPAVTNLTEYTAVPYYSPQYACVPCCRCICGGAATPICARRACRCTPCVERLPAQSDACECTSFHRLNFGACRG